MTLAAMMALLETIPPSRLATVAQHSPPMAVAAVRAGMLLALMRVVVVVLAYRVRVGLERPLAARLGPMAVLLVAQETRRQPQILILVVVAGAVAVRVLTLWLRAARAPMQFSEVVAAVQEAALRLLVQSPLTVEREVAHTSLAVLAGLRLVA